MEGSLTIDLKAYKCHACLDCAFEHGQVLLGFRKGRYGTCFKNPYLLSMQMHVHIANIQPSLRSVLYDIAKYQDSSAFINCPPGKTHLADNCKCAAVLSLSPRALTHYCTSCHALGMQQLLKICEIACMGLSWSCEQRYTH